MPKYYPNKICGYYLYYTSFCIIECMHVHASDSRLTESFSAKLFVRSDGSTVVQKQGALTDQGLRKIQSFIKEHYLEMWKTDSDNGFYEKKNKTRRRSVYTGRRRVLFSAFKQLKLVFCCLRDFVYI